MPASQKRTLEILVNVRDQVTRVMRRIARVLTATFTAPMRAIRRFSSALLSMRGLLVGVTAGLAVRKIVNTFAEFETGIAKIGTLLKEGEINLKVFGRALRDTSRDTGQTFEDLLQAGFDAVSNFGARGVQEFVDTAARLATAGFTSVENASNALIKTMLAYNAEVSEAGRISDAIFKAMEGGSADIEGLSDGISRVADTAAAAGLSIEGMLGMLSALTRSAPNVEVAATRMVALLNIMIEDGIRLSDSQLVPFFETLGTKSAAELRALLPNVRAFAGALGLSANNAENLRFVMDRMSNTLGATETAFGRAAATLNNQFERLRQTMLALLFEIGSALRPFIEDVIGRLQAFVADLADRGSQIRAVVQTVGEALMLIGRLAGQLLSSTQDLIRFFGNAVAAYIRVTVDIIAAGLPLLLRTVEVVGRELGSALIRAFVGETSLELARTIKQGGIGGFTVDLLARAVGIDTASIVRQVSELDELEHALGVLETRLEGFRNHAEALQKISLGGTDSSVRGIVQRALFGREEDASAEQQKFMQTMNFTLNEFESVVDRVRDRRDKVLFGLGGDATKAARDEAAAQLQDEVRTFWTRDLTATISGAIDTLRSGLSPSIQATIDAIASIPERAARRFAAATRHQLIVEAVTSLNEFFGRMRSLVAKGKAEMQGPPLPPGGVDRPVAPSNLLPDIPEIERRFTMFENAAIRAGRGVVGALSGVGNALLDVVQGISSTGDAFRQFGLSVARVLADIAAELLILSLIKAIFNPSKGSVLGNIIGLAEGGVTPGVAKTLPVRSYARGGVAREPQVAIFGEAGEEAFVPLAHGRIPVQLRGGGRSLVYAPTIQALDGPSVRRVLAEERKFIWSMMREGVDGADQQLAQSVRSR